MSELLTVAVTEPTLGCRQLADLLVRHGLGRRAHRVAKAAALAALTTGLVTETVAEGPFGFCHWAGRPGDLVALDSFYIGNLKGVGKVYQLTAIDTATRWALVWITLGPVRAEHSARFATEVVKRFRKLGVAVQAVLTDNGPEYIASGFTARLATLGLDHHRIPPRSPNHNAVCERFQGTPCRSAGARPSTAGASPALVSSRPRPMRGWCTTTADAATTATFMRGRRPAEVLDSHHRRRAA